MHLNARTLPFHAVFTIIMAGMVGSGCQGVRNQLIEWFTPDYQVEGGGDSGFKPQFVGPDAPRPRIEIALRKIATATHPTDIQFPPTGQPTMLLLEKEGTLRWFDLKTGKSGVLLQLNVLTRSEQGLLGMTFHPDFARNGLVYLNYSTTKATVEISRVSEWRVSDPGNIPGSQLKDERVIMEVEQPYPNHNAGQLAFGPDGMLYIGWGDGGWRDDPLGNGQNPATLLGAMLRVDVTADPATQKPYRIPADNPFLKQKGAAPEIFAIGLRNPWRYSFDERGRLVVADVGQDLFEEIDIVEAGGNYGWDVREAAHCFNPKQDCPTRGLTDPVYEYPREEGASITGGFVYTGVKIRELKNMYVFGDFVSGRLWAIRLPDRATDRAGVATSLGKWPLLPATFGRDHAGELYLGDYATGVIFRLEPAR